MGLIMWGRSETSGRFYWLADGSADGSGPGMTGSCAVEIRKWRVAVRETIYRESPLALGPPHLSRRIHARTPATPMADAAAMDVGVELNRNLGGLRLRGMLEARYAPASSNQCRLEVVVSGSEFCQGDCTFPGILPGSYFPGIDLEFAPGVLESAQQQVRVCRVPSGDITFYGGGYDMESAEVVFRLAAGVLIRRVEAVQRELDFEESVDRFLGEYGY